MYNPTVSALNYHHISPAVRWKRKSDAHHTVLYTVAMIHLHPLEWARESCKNKSCRWMRVMYEVQLEGRGAFVSPNRETTFFQFCRGYEQRMSVETNKICSPYARISESYSQRQRRGSDTSRVRLTLDPALLWAILEREGVQPFTRIQREAAALNVMSQYG
jgi:hypothetical protein